MHFRRTILLITLSALLLCVISLTTIMALQPAPPVTLTTSLADLLPREIEGWTVKDQPIAESEEMKKAVGELLNYDDAIFRTYSHGPVTFSVYIAYWKPDKMSPRLVATHTPDVCWVGNGWKCTARNLNYLIPRFESEPMRHQQALKSFPPAQAGTYELNGDVQHVLFWHIHNGKIVNYATGQQPPLWAPLSDLWREGLNLRGEQFFIRISGNVPAETFARTIAFQRVINVLAGPLTVK